MPPTRETPFRRPRRTHPGRILAAIVLAVLLHALFVLGVFAAGHFKLVLPPEPAPPVKQSVALRTLSPQQWASNRGDRVDAQANSQTPLKPREEPPPPKHPQGQVVAVAPGNDQAPKDSKYLSEHNNTVQKETRARETTPNYRNPMPQRTTTTPPPKVGPQIAEAPRVTGNGGTGQDEHPAQKAQKQGGALQIPDVKPRDRIAMRTPRDGQGPGLHVPNQPESDELHGNSNRLQLDPSGERGGQAAQDGSLGRAGHPGMANLIPSQAMLDKIDGAAANDRLQDVEEGDQTFLNTQEWKFAGFFNRVKQSVGTQWNPGTVLHSRDPTGNIYGERDRYTMLSVTLSQDGSLKDVRVTRSCGVDFLDQEAVRAFQRAQPFPNPPPGLLASDQTVHFQFGFFLEMNGMPGIRLFRPSP